MSKLYVFCIALAATLSAFPPCSWAEPSAQLAKRLELGDCQFVEGKCYKPMRMIVSGDPAMLARPLASPNAVVWRIDLQTGEQTRFEFAIDELLPESQEAPSLPFDRPQVRARSNTRTPINDTTEFPYSSVLKLFMSIPGTQYGAACSGMMLSETVALTAGHCCYSNDASQGIPEGILSVDYVIPAMNGTDERPFGFTEADELWIPDEWKNPRWNEEFNHDWCVMHLTRDMGSRTQWMDLVSATARDSYFNRKNVHIAGYPGDLRDGNYMYEVEGTIAGVYGSIIYHDAYTYQGNSGGPNFFILDEDTGSYEIVGIVSHGFEYDGQHWNGSTMIKTPVVEAIREAMDCSAGCEEGARKCLGASQVQSCEINSFGCLSWSTSRCGDEQTCVLDGQCADCEHACNEGKQRCSDDHTVEQCVPGELGCREWQEEKTCGLREICVDAECLPQPDGTDGDTPDPDACTGACQPIDAPACLSDGHSICECRELRWTVVDCADYCADEGHPFKSCGLDLSEGVEACQCRDLGGVDGDLPDGDSQTSGEPEVTDGSTSGGCASTPAAGWFLLLSLLALSAVKRRQRI